MSNKYQDIVQRARTEQSMVNIGHGNFIASGRIVAVLETGPLPIRRLREQAQKEQRLLDASGGRKMRSLVITDSNHVVISGLAPATLLERMKSPNSPKGLAERELTEGEFVS